MQESVSGHALVDKNFYFDATIFCASLCGLVGGYWSGLAHGSWRYNAPNRYVTVLEQKGNYVLCAFHAEFLIHCRVAARIGEALYLNDVARQIDGIVGQLL